MALKRRRALVVAAFVLAAIGARAWWVRGTAARETGVHVLRGVGVVRLLDPRSVAKLGTLDASFEITPGGHAVMCAGGALLELAFDGGGLQADRLPPADAFALDGAGLLVVTGRFLGQLEEDGTFSRAVPLPADRMRLAPSTRPGRVYLFGGEGDLPHRLYALDQDGSLAIVAELPESIVAVADSAHAIYLATAGAIYRVTPERLSLAFRLPSGAEPLTALAADPSDRALYFADRARVHALRGAVALSLVSDAGGALRWQDGALYVWDASRRLLLHLDGVEHALDLGGIH